MTKQNKQNCIRLRRLFGDSYKQLGIIDRHKYWVKYVNNSNLTDYEKELCKREFLNPKNLKRYRKNK